MSYVKHPVTTVAVFIWTGLVVGIAFMVSWLKYRAFGVTLPVGASIDMKLLPALMRVEWVLAIAVAIDLFFGKASLPMMALAAVPVVLLLIQTIYLQPGLNASALQIFHGHGDTGATLRNAQTGLEALKVATLIMLGILQFKNAIPRAGHSAPQPNKLS
ncbi:MAG: hypothetical protein LKM36_01600 [Flavobacteriales bacterium]|jgi:hypothetical protein|nr:hypothetical protein [Flavobacteriales bacterium]MCI1751587.1 hypothetical protein [Flavobacteriales bacterium]